MPNLVSARAANLRAAHGIVGIISHTSMYGKQIFPTVSVVFGADEMAGPGDVM